ncbi:hypothetical protein [uncultured Alistipes sp.]|jgi:lipoprotein|uniref:hypothetical protein n=1 Tax=uncultured Alistipes sp. TaxID=538949 RepID=UPI0025CED7F5|nr:hypothetical protein [uncultured Alistipes sp.]
MLNPIRKITAITVLVIVAGLFWGSCRSNGRATSANGAKRIYICDYRVWISNLDKKDLEDSLALYIDTINCAGRKTIVHCESAKCDPSGTYYIPYSIENDSLFFWDYYCPNIDTVRIEYKGRNIELVKSYYDLENSIDEELDIYWNSEYGLVAEYNYPSGVLTLFEREGWDGFAKELFYNYIIDQERRKKTERISHTGQL